MDDTEINALNPDAFERMLHDRWAVSRRDIYVGSVAPPRSLDASQPTRPPQALNRVEHLTSLKRIITELGKFCGGLEQHRGKQRSVLSGQWTTSPITRTLPPRQAALEHALAKRLITRDEHDAATGRPDDCLTASDIPGRG